jgi:hypothetical protein
VYADTLHEAIVTTLAMWPFPDPPLGLMIHMDMDDDEGEEASDAKVHRT